MLLIIRKSFFKIFYRKFFDKFEEYIIGMVYKVLVNSYFIGKILIVVFIYLWRLFFIVFLILIINIFMILVGIFKEIFKLFGYV